ncbi:MAG: hypothetical protein AMXMBFR83_00420 [Phycisphaerae bacterium]
MFTSHRRATVVLLSAAASIGMSAGLFGCKTDKPEESMVRGPEGPTASLENPEGVKLPDVDVTGQTEVDLVEQLTEHRAQYARLLRLLVAYYTENGHPDKAAWAATELEGLRRVKTYRYLKDAEVPRADLKPTTSISEADRLYEQAKALMKKAGHGTIIFYNQAKMREALGLFKELVDKYPNSDKIDDAAYYIGEIYKEYEEEKDNELAIWWYQRAIEWDPNTPHPCRFRIATTYDYRLHEREKALYWYQQTLQHESRFTERDDPDFALNTKYATARIRELTPEEHLRSPGDSVAQVRPAPQPSPAPGPTEPTK